MKQNDMSLGGSLGDLWLEPVWGCASPKATAELAAYRRYLRQFPARWLGGPPST